ncbi:g12054 [Coccomyxa viridis]|uniref:G12054 protein n=1 Tax=Coccomyxa viridis TaxID=1274662 RepID=A0ABP1GAJ2_9CHLO
MAEKALSTLHQQHKSASQYVALLDNTIEDLSGSQKLTEAEVDCIMELRGEQAVKSLEAQLKLWKRYIGKDKDLLDEQTAQHTPVMSDEQRRQSARSKLAAMGGRPVLGSFSMCESELLQHRRGLNATASPAAQEVARLRSGSTSPADALPAGPSGQAEASPAWLGARTGVHSPTRHSNEAAPENIAVSS